ncbi:MAG: hypothetical protein L3K25_06105 [Gammaproteobacteria bacterium]|nr:hypothetical protein [Gammaproteobacteria bacterium]MCF6337209.1 hypothetical protein [Gammaproteobacteria bacterium]
MLKQQTHPGSTATFFTVTTVASPDEHHLAKKGIHISVRANDARLVHRVMGPVTNSVNGVPAEPVDSFDWSGSEITPIRGHAKLEIDPIANTGTIKAKWKDEYGHWTCKQTIFAPPPSQSTHGAEPGLADGDRR